MVLLSTMIFGQVDQGNISGTVKDSTGAVIPGVSVAITNDRTGEQRTAVTGDRGDYAVRALKPSTYTVTASLPGFATTQANALQLVVGQTLISRFDYQASGCKRNGQR